ncbi:MAG TPA: transposase [Candidatus Angelobacter sp.]|nr:transposase [Candidatus Angelobacter sp.]
MRLVCSATDKWAGYNALGMKFPHATVDHAKGQYVIGAVHTQTIEGFWSIFKRGIVGSHPPHHLSPAEQTTRQGVTEYYFMHPKLE